MTPAQRHLYIRAARATFAAASPDPSDKSDPSDFNAWRHHQVAAALGRPKSFRDFTNADLDCVLAHFRLLARPDDFTAALASVDPAADGERKRLLFVCDRLARDLGHRDAATILCGRLGHRFGRDLDALDLEALRQLRYTLNARLRKIGRAHV